MRVCISVYHPSYSYKVQENHLHFWAYISYMHSLCTRVCIVSPSAASYPCPSMPQRCKLSSWTLESVESSWRSWSWFAWPGWIGWISEVTCRKNQENGWKWEHCQKKWSWNPGSNRIHFLSLCIQWFKLWSRKGKPNPNLFGSYRLLELPSPQHEPHLLLIGFQSEVVPARGTAWIASVPSQNPRTNQGLQWFLLNRSSSGLIAKGKENLRKGFNYMHAWLYQRIS